MRKRVSRSNRLTSKSTPGPIEPLEGRVMLSNTAPTVTITWNGASVKAVQNQYITEVRNSARFNSLITQKGFTNVKSLGSTFYQFDSALSVATMQKLAHALPLTLKTIEPNLITYAASTLPNDPLLSSQWGVHNTGQVEPYDYNRDGVVTPYNEIQNPTPPATIDFPSPPYPNENQVGTVGEDVNLQAAWDITTGSSNVVIADMDTGVDITHPDLINNIWVNPLDTAANGNNGDGFPGDINGYNFVDNNADVMDFNGHGTIDAGIIGASGNNGIGVTGVNWNVKVLPVKILGDDGSGTTAGIIAGTNYLVTLKDSGINIVAANESLGGDAFPDNILDSDSVAMAGKAGILIVVAAGNDSKNVDVTNTQPARYSLASSNVITVAALDNQGNLAAFSNFGATSVNLAAPGVDIFNTTPTYAVTLNAEVAQEPDIPQFTENYGYSTGTSQATPTVTGILGLEAAANPNASMLQLKNALLSGVTYDSKLAASNGNPPLVATSGVANAYQAVLNVLNPIVGTNTTRQGSWSGFYGSQGSYVVGESTSFPSFVTASQAGGSPVILADSTKNLAAPQRVSDPTSRISAYEAASSTESISLDFTDGQSHQVELYLADLDHKRRTEEVDVIDNATGNNLESTFVSNFTKGTYVTFTLQGSVSLRLDNKGGPSVVYSGIFFDTPTTKPNTVLGTDSTTTGQNWRNTYGSQGAVIAGDTQSLPSYVSSFSTSGAITTVVAAKSKAATALQKIDDVTTGIQAYYGSTTQEDFDLTFNDTMIHNATFYVADYKNKHRSERFEAINATTGAILATQDVTNFTKGQYVTFAVSGSVIFRVINTGPARSDVAVSGIFLDAPFGENASFQGTDLVTRGNWKASLYGLTGAYVVGDNFPGVDDTANQSISETGATRHVVGVPSSDPTALFKTGVTDAHVRVAAYLQTTTSMTLDINPGDLNQHQVALYFADYENDKRVESVTIYNGNTNTVLSHQVISNFRKGKYLVFDIAGPVLVTINSGGSPNAVLSGVFMN